MANNYTPSYNQYRTQTAGYALPSSVRTYSVFDPATGTWTRMTNGNPVQNVVPTQPKQQSRPRQVMRPLARNNARDVSVAINPQPIVVNGEESIGVNGSGMTPSGIEFVGDQPISLDRTQNIPPEYDGEIRNLNNVPTSSGVVGQPVVNVDPADIGQSVPIREATPKLNMSDYKPYGLWGNIGAAIAIPAEIGATALTSGLGVALNGARALPSVATAARALNYGRNLGTAASTSAKAGSRLGSIRDAVTGLYNRAGGFLRREHAPTADFTVDAAGNAQATSPYTTNVINDFLRNNYQRVRNWWAR